MIDIILCMSHSNAQTLFSGVHIFGPMDPSQLQPINMHPFLTSAFKLFCNQMVELKHSLCTYSDPDFQYLQ